MVEKTVTEVANYELRQAAVNFYDGLMKVEWDQMDKDTQVLFVAELKDVAVAAGTYDNYADIRKSI